MGADIGDVLQQLGRHQEAISAYDAAIGATPGNDPRVGSYYLSRSHAWLAAGDPGRALADALEAARRGTPVDSLYLMGLGR
jgi:tetratricopeptide (TPR) repeat protein